MQANNKTKRVCCVMSYIHLVIKVTPSIVRHLNALPLRMPYWLTFLDVRFAELLSAAGIVATSPISMSPIG